MEPVHEQRQREDDAESVRAKNATALDNVRALAAIASRGIKRADPALYMIYKQADEDFAKELYWAAYSVMPERQLDAIARRKGVQRVLYDPHVTHEHESVPDYTIVLSETRAYLRLAQAVRSHARHLVGASMIYALQLQISARSRVDQWYKKQRKDLPEQHDLDSVSRHAFFTAMLKEVKGILLPIEERHPQCLQDAITQAMKMVAGVEEDPEGVTS